MSYLDYWEKAFGSCVNDAQPLIIDQGSSMMKVGFGGDDVPRACFPTVVGRPKSPGIMVGMDAKDCFVGDEAQAKRGILRMKWPIEDGLVTNWNDMEKIWHHSFYNEICCCPGESHYIFTDSPRAPTMPSQREKMCSIMFETFSILGLFVACSEVMSLYATGETTGLVLGSGADSTHVVPVYHGVALTYGVQHQNIAGRIIREYLCRLLAERGYDLVTSAEKALVKDMKEKFCYVVENDVEEDLLKSEATGCAETSYAFPDGSSLELSNERFQASEILFDPQVGQHWKMSQHDWEDLPFYRRCRRTPQVFNHIDETYVGIPTMVQRSMQSIDETLRDEMWSNIVLAGGNTMLPGLQARLQNELSRLEDRTVNVIAPENRKYSSWIGASILSKLSSFLRNYVTKEEYDDCGNSIVRRKCF